MAYRYERPFRVSPETMELLSILPSWMKMRSDETSVGFRFVNAWFGIEAEETKHRTQAAVDDTKLVNADTSQVAQIHKTVHIGEDPLPVDLPVTATTGDVSWLITEAEDIPTFTDAPPTRFSIVRSFSPGSEDILGMSYCVNWYSSGVWPMRDGDLHDRLILSEDVDLDNQWLAPIKVYTYDSSFDIDYTGDWMRGRQAYDVNGVDELFDAEGGDHLVQNHDLLPSSLVALDYSNLDASGAPTQLEAGAVLATGNWVSQGGYHPVANPVASGWSGVVALEYMYKKGSQSGPLCCTQSWGEVDFWDEVPALAMTTRPSNKGIPIPVSFADTPPASTGITLLAADPWLLRPGTTGTVEFTYGATASGVWDFPQSGHITFDFGSVSGFERTDESQVYVTDPSGIPVREDFYTVTQHGASGVYITLEQADGRVCPTGSIFYLGYEATSSYGFTSTGALDFDDATTDAYPYDWEYADASGARFVVGKTIISVEDPGALNARVATSPISSFEVYYKPSYKGAFYHKGYEEAWLWDRASYSFHAYGTNPLQLKRRIPAYQWNGDRRSAMPSGALGLEEPFLNLHVPTGVVSPGPCEMVGDHILMYNEVDGSTQIEIMNGYSWDFFPVTSTVPLHPIGTPTDMTVTASGSVLFSVGSTIWEVQPYYDYFIADREEGVIYYRELYDEVDPSGVS